MLRAYVDKIDRLGISGWAIDDRNLQDRVTLIVMCNVNNFRERIRCDVLRPDLAGQAGFGDGKHGFSYRFPPEIASKKDLGISIVYAATGRPVSGGYMTYPVTGFEAEPKPIIVTAQGRSGTTLLMNTLLQSPDVCVAGNPPFEVRMCHYYALAFGVLTGDADHTNSTHPDEMDFAKKWIGSNPFFDKKAWSEGSPPEAFVEYFNVTVPKLYINLFREAILDFYRAGTLASGKSGVKYFAEKNIWALRTIPRFVNYMFPDVKEIIMLRDPRDLVVSQRSYFEGVRGTHLDEISQHCSQYLDIISRGPENTMAIRYEDLVTNWETECEKISSYLGINIPVEKRDLVDKTFTSHARSASPARSMGRWRQELSDDDRLKIEKSCAKFMEAFGYE